MFLFFLSNKHNFFCFFFIREKNENNILIGKSWLTALTNKIRFETKEINGSLEDCFSKDVLFGVFL